MNLVKESISVLNDSILYLEQLSKEEYIQEIELMSNSTIGQHTRHFIEFFQCLIAQEQNQTINYCLRERDLNIQQNPAIAIQAINEINTQLEGLDLDAAVLLFTSKESTESIPSTVARELSYNIEHCIHHLALIKIGLKILRPDIKLPSSFGVAASTIRHRKAVTS